LDAASLKTALGKISEVVSENRDYLVRLDQQNGDGDLGISMSDGFKAVADFVCASDETDLGKLFSKMSAIFNEKAPSSLGTILSFGMMGMAVSLKGKENASVSEIADAMSKGLAKIMEKAGSKPGEKTILDSMCPAVGVLAEKSGHDAPELAFKAAAVAAAEGSESTRAMLSKHGRAAYYGEKSIGVLDGGSVVGRLIFEALSQCHSSAKPPIK
jgi:dihydroxyacetone kinase-like protein